MSDNYLSYRQMFMQAMQQRYTNPQATVKLLQQVSALAREEYDPHEALFIDHWLLQTLINVIEDYNQALDLAVQTAVEARKPIYRSQMERVCVHEDLISTYMGIDPIGYAKMVEDAMAYMERETTPTVECYYCQLGLRSSFEMNFGATEKCETAVMRYYSETQSYDRHHHGTSHLDVCWLFYQRGEWEKLLPYTLKGIEVIDDNEQLQGTVAALWAARALALRKLGRESEADAAFQRAKTKAALMQIPLSRQFYDMLCDFHLEVGEVDEAITLRERQLMDVINKGQPYWESMIRLSYAQLLKQSGQSFDEQTRAIRALATQLKKPEVVLDPLAAFEAEA